MASDLHVIILAAGLGTRMKSETPKVLHRVAGRPLVFWPLALAQTLGARRVLVVLGHKLELVRAALDARYPGAAEVVRQEQMLGTGDAVRQALPALAAEPDDARVLILYGDVPLLGLDVCERLLAAQGGAPLALVTTRLADPTGYGRVVRTEGGAVARIVEHKDASAAERALDEVNAGIYAISLGFLRRELPLLTPQNAQGELYLTDLVARAAAAGAVPSCLAPPDDVAGVNDRVDLARMDGIARRRIAEGWMRAGVTIVAPDTVAIDADVAAIGRDVELGPGVALRGARTRVEDGARIDAGCVVTDSVVGAGAVVKPYSVLSDSQIGARAQIGPFAHCRPGSVLEDDVHLGNFVETKKAHLGRGAKANHLAYLGDAEIGAKSNIGAGTITCNYDGVDKHKTVIGEGVFIGSDTQLVAPVTVGKGAYVGAGTTVTEDVPPGALALTRTPQVNVEGYVEKKRLKREAQAKATKP
jgi:bifunctional UDP-N-acetylglucosamine pyrophosphorylase/glucosamine-1-phosphate N-acetyltransferase